jgi:hypothetical protein
MPLSLTVKVNLPTSADMPQTEFARGECVVIIKSGPLRDKEGTVLLADSKLGWYCVKLDEPVGSRKLAVIEESNLMQSL